MSKTIIDTLSISCVISSCRDQLNVAAQLISTHANCNVVYKSDYDHLDPSDHSFGVRGVNPMRKSIADIRAETVKKIYESLSSLEHSVISHETLSKLVEDAIDLPPVVADIPRNISQNRDISIKNQIAQLKLIESRVKELYADGGPLVRGQKMSYDDNSERARIQKTLNRQSIDLLMPFLGGEVSFNQFLFDSCSSICREIFGDRLSLIAKKGARNHYSHSAELHLDGMPAGFICWCHQQGGFMIYLSGSGCAATDMKRVHDVLSGDARVFNPKITRLDIALDDIAGEYINHEMVLDLIARGYFCPDRGPAPRYAIFDSGHIVRGVDSSSYTRVSDLGRTIYCGSREGGKLFRCYEKGLERGFGYEFQNHYRIEVEYRSKDRIIPLDSLIDTDAYFIGSCRAAQIAYSAIPLESPSVEPKKIRVFRARLVASAEHAIHFASLQSSRTIYMMREILQMHDSAIIDRLLRPLDGRSIHQRIPRHVALPAPVLN